MPLTRLQKAEVVKMIREEILPAESVVFVSFRGLKVAAVNDLRRTLQTLGVNYRVVKKTLLQRAMADFLKPPAPAVALSSQEQSLATHGTVALVYSAPKNAPVKKEGFEETKLEEEVVCPPASGIYGWQVKTGGEPPAIQIIGGLFGGQFKAAAEMVEIAMIPSRQLLWGRLLSLLSWPITSLIVVLGQISKTKISQ